MQLRWPTGAVVSVVWLLTRPAIAALPPVHERIAQLHAAAEAAQKVLGERLIDSVRLQTDGLFEVEADSCQVRVRLRRAKPSTDILGPATYDTCVVSARCP